jgi:hypothetical protein
MIDGPGQRKSRIGRHIMTRRRSSFGFLGMFGRSSDLRQLDQALRVVDLHPALVPDGVKLAIVNLMKDHWPIDDPPPEAYPSVAQLFGYCVAGPEAFERINGRKRLADTERRVEDALEAEESLDAQLVLLALHAKLISPEVVERYHLRADERQ